MMKVSTLYRKLLAIAVMAAAFLMPQLSIERLVEERRERHDESTAAIAREWGAPVEVRGPLARIPYTPASGELGDGWKTTRYAYAVPRDLQVNATIATETRYRGIFRARVYSGTVTLSGRFAAADLPNAKAGEIDWKNGGLYVFLPDAQALASSATLEAGRSTRTMTRGAVVESANAFHVMAPLAMGDLTPEGDLPFTITLNVKGTQRLKITPFALSTQATLRSDWSAPSFLGTWLPLKRQLNGDDGFEAEFHGTEAAAAFTRIWTNERFEPWTSAIATFGVELIEPVGHYQQVMRAVKYGALFIVLTFACFFLFETMAGLRLHPIQYLAVGAALTIFYLLLLSLSEHVPFAGAYAAAAGAVVCLVSVYTRSVLKHNKLWLVIAGALSALYAYLFVLLQLESLSLLFGSFGLFLLLAAFMYATRNVDWYKLGESAERAPS